MVRHVSNVISDFFIKSLERHFPIVCVQEDVVVAVRLHQICKRVEGVYKKQLETGNSAI